VTGTWAITDEIFAFWLYGRENSFFSFQNSAPG
jgi:hypothetical protein